MLQSFQLLHCKVSKCWILSRHAPTCNSIWAVGDHEGTTQYTRIPYQNSLRVSYAVECGHAQQHCYANRAQKIVHQLKQVFTGSDFRPKWRKSFWCRYDVSLLGLGWRQWFGVKMTWDFLGRDDVRLLTEVGSLFSESTWRQSFCGSRWRPLILVLSIDNAFLRRGRAKCSPLAIKNITRKGGFWFVADCKSHSEINDYGADRQLIRFALNKDVFRGGFRVHTPKWVSSCYKTLKICKIRPQSMEIPEIHPRTFSCLRLWRSTKFWMTSLKTRSSMNKENYWSLIVIEIWW